MDRHVEIVPASGRSDDKVQGHWLLARLGKKVLRPGGVALTRRMLDHTGIEGRDVVELTPGLGGTAQEIIERNPAGYVGVDGDPDAAARVRQVVAGRGTRALARSIKVNARPQTRPAPLTDPHPSQTRASRRFAASHRSATPMPAPRS